MELSLRVLRPWTSALLCTLPLLHVGAMAQSVWLGCHTGGNDPPGCGRSDCDVGLNPTLLVTRRASAISGVSQWPGDMGPYRIPTPQEIARPPANLLAGATILSAGFSHISWRNGHMAWSLNVPSQLRLEFTTGSKVSTTVFSCSEIADPSVPNGR